MPVTFGGMASGLNTDDIIKKLVEVEARPIQQWEGEILVHNKRKDALGVLKNHLTKINDAAKNLYGHRASYSEKKVVTSDPASLEAVANKFAENGTRSVEVLELASTHKISSDSIKTDQALPPGKFTLEVNGASKTVRFKGGTLKALQEHIDAAASDIVSTSYVNTAEDRNVLTVESKSQGQKGAIKLSGDRDLLFTSGLAGALKDKDKEKMALVFDGKYFTSYGGKAQAGETTGKIEVDASGKSFAIKGRLWREYVLPVEIAVKKNTVMEFYVDYAAVEEEKDDALPYRLEVGPDEKTVIKGIELRGYNVSRIRPLKKKEPGGEIADVMGVGIIPSGDGGMERIYPIDRKFKGKMEIPVGRDFESKKIGKIIFYCNDGTARFSDAAIYTPQEDRGQYDPKNEIAKANDARLKIDGIEVRRDRNEGLSDVIKGLTLNLRGKSERPLTVKVEPDVQKSLDRIKEFVAAYNGYIDYSKELTKAERTAKPGEFRKNQPKSGLFVGDMVLLKLENSMKETVSSAYPSRSEKPIRLITQIGVSTGAVNAAWESIREGKLVVDEGMLGSVVRENPEGVEEFFGSDTDGDNRIDNGMAYRMENLLKVYVGTGKNVISSRMDLEDTGIKNTNERIARQTEHLRRYEEKLRKKFATMEQSISGAKTKGDWLRNQMKGMEGEQEK